MIEQPRLQIFDAGIVGGGVVGCAMARRFTLEGAKTLLIERAPDILAGASKGNSAILHTGYDAEPGSLELACVKAGYAEYLSIREQLGLPVLETGAMVIAWSQEEEAKLPGILEIAREKVRQLGLANIELHCADRHARPVSRGRFDRRSAAPCER